MTPKRRPFFYPKNCPFSPPPPPTFSYDFCWICRRSEWSAQGYHVTGRQGYQGLREARHRFDQTSNIYSSIDRLPALQLPLAPIDHCTRSKPISQSNTQGDMRKFLETQPKLEGIFPKMFPKQCEVCKRQDGLLRCGGCNTYYYCGREHQVADRSTHKGTCKAIKDAKTAMEEAEANLRADTPNYLETYAGNLWNWIPSRLYLYAVYSYGEVLVRSWRRQGIEDALDVYLRLLQLNQADQQRVRDLIPSLYIRLGRDQEAYDFLKYWALHFNGLLDTEQPFLGVRNADAYEGVDLWASKPMPLTHAVTVLLIKVRLLIGLQSVQRMKAWKASKEDNVAAISGSEVLDWLRDQLRPFCGNIFEREPEILGDDGLLEEKLSAMAGHIGTLVKAIGDYNIQFWPMFLGPEEADLGSERTGYHAPGSLGEARLAFMHTYSAWCETEGAIQGVRNVFSDNLAE